ncbi:TPA: hypothetical protein ACGXQD_005589 [Bacillus cereus]|nr:hypothetical protein [Bacillus cereus]
MGIRKFKTQYYLETRTLDPDVQSDFDLSPGELVEDNRFTINVSDFLAVTQYAANGSMLPVNKQELLKYLYINEQTKIPDSFNKLYPVYELVRQHTREYRDTIFPMVSKLTTNLKIFTSYSIATLSVAIDLLNEIRDGGNVEVLGPDLKETLRILVRGYSGSGGSEAFKAQLITVSEMLGTFMTNTENDKGNINTLHLEMKTAFEKHKAAVEQMQKDVKAIQMEIEQKLAVEQSVANMKNWVKLNPVLGVLAESILRLLPASIQHLIDKLKKDLETKDEELKRDIGVGGLLERVDSQTGHLRDQVAAALIGLAKIRGAWDTISDSVANVLALDNAQFVDANFNSQLKVSLLTSRDLWLNIQSDVILFDKAAHYKAPAEIYTYEPGPHKDRIFPVVSECSC